MRPRRHMARAFLHLTVVGVAILVGFAATTAPVLAQSVRWETISSITEPYYFHPLVDRILAAPSGTIFTSIGVRSDDTGRTWTQSEIFAWSLAVAPNGDLLFGTNAGILRSADNGTTTTMLSPDLASYRIDDIFIAAGTWIARSEGKIFRSEDAGATWDMTGDFASSTFARLIVDFGVLDENVMFCIADVFDPVDDLDRDSSGVYRSTDGGATWRQTTYSVGVLSEDGLIGMTALCVAPNGTLIAAAQGLDVSRSVDNGQSWSSSNLYDITSTIISAGEGTFFASTANSGVYRSTDDGRNWSPVNQGLFEVRVFPLILHPSGRLILMDVFGNVSRTVEPVVDLAEPTDVRSEWSRAGTPSLRVAPGTSGIAFVVDGIRNIGSARLTLYDVFGREAPSLIGKPTRSADGQWNFAVGEIAPGTYVACIESDGFTTATMFMIPAGEVSLHVHP